MLRDLKSVICGSCSWQIFSEGHAALVACDDLAFMNQAAACARLLLLTVLQHLFGHTVHAQSISALQHTVTETHWHAGNLQSGSVAITATSRPLCNLDFDT